jgi:hypothetical protein
MEYDSDVARIFVPILCCSATRENLDEYNLARIIEYQFIDLYHPRSNRIANLKIEYTPTTIAPDPALPEGARCKKLRLVMLEAV